MDGMWFVTLTGFLKNPVKGKSMQVPLSSSDDSISIFFGYKNLSSISAGILWSKILYLNRILRKLFSFQDEVVINQWEQRRKQGEKIKETVAYVYIYIYIYIY